MNTKSNKKDVGSSYNLPRAPRRVVTALYIINMCVLYTIISVYYYYISSFLNLIFLKVHLILVLEYDILNRILSYVIFS